MYVTLRSQLLAFVSAGLVLAGLPTSADQVDDYVQSQMKVGRWPGVALAVNRGGKLVKLAGYGLANVEWNVPVTPQTVFQIQSVTKQFTATAIMMLAEEGKLSLDAKVSAYLDGTPESWKDITIRHLLNQTSGIKDFINEPTASLRLEVTEEEVFKATVNRPLNSQPGEKYAYSNTNYHLLAMIIRKITGHSYGDFLKQRVFDPLQMGRTRLMSWSDIITNRAAGYNQQNGILQNGQFVAGSILAYGGGGILSTAEDMAKWDAALRSDALVQHSVLEQMWLPAKLNGGGVSSYGFGWGIGGQAPHRFVQHSGGHITGFTSYIVRFLDDDLSVIVLANSGYANPGKIAHAIAGLYIPELKPPERKAIEDKEPKVTELLKQTEEMLRGARLERDLFAPQLYAVLAASLQDTSQRIQAGGKLNAIELLERKELPDGARQYVYRMRFENTTPQVVLTLDKKSIITGLEAHED
jgi:CubicO group peptidase (beta-lactamase class C family)